MSRPREELALTNMDAETIPRAGRLRTLLLAVVALGVLGLGMELLLLEHWIARAQLTPLVTLTLMLAVVVGVAVRPTRKIVRAFQLVMLWAVAAGIIGITFHFRDNFAFELEVTPEASAPSLAWHALSGATPLLAPGSLVQLGLVGLVLTLGHPALDARKDLGPDQPHERTETV